MPDHSVSLVISVRVLPDRRADFLTGISRNAVASVRDEPGCLRFDVAADASDEDLFWVYEVFADREALEAHRRTPHYLAWQAQKDALIVPGSQSDRLGPLLVSEG